MAPNNVLNSIRHGLIVSCHVDDDVGDSEIFRYFVRAAVKGGASGLRVEGVERMKHLRRETDLPVVAFTTGNYGDGSMLITPTLDDIDQLFDAGADIVAVDVTRRKRPDGTDAFVFFEQARKRFDSLLWADVATFREGVQAAEIGADVVATTLAGYTPGTLARDYRTPDYMLIQELGLSLTIPVIAEGRIWTPEDAARAIEMGAFAVVVGSAITRPSVITSMFVSALGSLNESC